MSIIAPFMTNMLCVGMTIHTLWVLILILLVLDWVSGNVLALVSNSWTVGNAKKGVYKIVEISLLGGLATILDFPFGSQMDLALHGMGAFLTLNIMKIQTLSILGNIAGISVFTGVKLPGLTKVLDYCEKWDS